MLLYNVKSNFWPGKTDHLEVSFGAYIKDFYIEGWVGVIQIHQMQRDRGTCSYFCTACAVNTNFSLG